MSSKTMELIAENDLLKHKVGRLRMSNALLTESEQELAKKNQTHQRVIKLLVEKLKGAGCCGTSFGWFSFGLRCYFCRER